MTLPKNLFIVNGENLQSKLIFEFTDEGMEYNPLEKPDPDINLPPEERPLGGLGIFMVKEMTDNISYKRAIDKLKCNLPHEIL